MRTWAYENYSSYRLVAELVMQRCESYKFGGWLTKSKLTSNSGLYQEKQLK